MKTARKSKRFRYALQAVLLVAVVCGAAVRSGAVEPASQPSTQPADTAAAKEFMPDNISEAAIKLTHSQKVALSAVRDGQHWRETAFYKMLARTAELVDPEASGKEFPSLESPAIGNLLDYPNRYRAQKIRATVRVHQSREYVSGSKDWDVNADWPRGKKVWYMTGFRLSERGANSEKKIPAQEIVVFSLVDPTELLGEPDATSADGASTYGQSGMQIEMSGVFYKTYRQEIADSTPTNRLYRDYPLLLAYYLKASQQPSGGGSEPTGMRDAIIVVGVILMGLLYMVRKHAKQARSAPIRSGTSGNVKYTPLRNVEEDNLPDEERENEPVNQDLVDAVKAFEKKSEKSDGTDHKS
jgi:hypothetical protein